MSHELKQKAPVVEALHDLKGDVRSAEDHATLMQWRKEAAAERADTLRSIGHSVLVDVNGRVATAEEVARGGERQDSYAGNRRG